MRQTIVGVFAVVVLIVTVISFGLMQASLGDLANQGAAKRAVSAAAGQIQLEGLRIERWLAIQGASEEAQEPFAAGSAGARADAATKTANTLEAQSQSDPAFAGVRATMIVFFDKDGLVIGRNGSKLMRGENLADRHPNLAKVLKVGGSGSAVWLDEARSEQLFASYAVVRSKGAIIGGILVGTAFNNERLQVTNPSNSKIGLMAAAKMNDRLQLVAQTSQVTAAMLVAVPSTAAALQSGQVVSVGGLSDSLDGAAVALAGYGDGRQALLFAVAPASIVEVGGLFGAAFGAFILGLLMVTVGAHLINNYIAQPISDLEDGLLTIINGQTDLRFELEHKVLGGLVFRVNSLLNTLLGVAVDNTDEDGRPSVAPSSQAFRAALNVDERMVSLSVEDVENASSLRDEEAADYYKRLFDEYVTAKGQIGDPTDHIKFAPFSQRVKALERQASNKHGKPFRYRVEVKEREIMFVAVPLS